MPNVCITFLVTEQRTDDRIKHHENNAGNTNRLK